MKGKFLLLFIIVLGMVMTSCFGPQMVGRSTINTVYWPELSLERKDYTVLQRVTATATVTYDATSMRKQKIIGENNEFLIVIKPLRTIIDFGVVKFGYPTGDVGKTTVVQKGPFKKVGLTPIVPTDPETVARQLAMYRLINEAKAIGADALIEPIISSDVASISRKSNVIKTTVSAKAVIIKPDK
jgi:hypothetical protein